MVRGIALVLAAVWIAACGGGEEAPTVAEPTPPELPESMPRGLLLALSTFEVNAEGKVLPNPQPARLEILTRQDGEWQTKALDDPDSNVFHKAMVYEPESTPGILTLGGMGAMLKLWQKGELGLQARVLWSKDFGGRFSRMRDAEAADLDGDGDRDLAVATHDQGVVAVVWWEDGRPRVEEIDAEADTFVHEIEIGDLDGDGTPEVYATPSEPNRLDGTPQKGVVTRYVPARDEGPVTAVDLGTRHAKEILVDDVDGDGSDELYVAVEGESTREGGTRKLADPVEIRRYESGTGGQGAVIATIEDQLCRFLTAGDVDGDGRKELVAAAFRAGLWLLQPGEDPNAEWEATLIDADSSGFEHASVLTDLDGDGTDELYVASDDQGEIRRYDWTENGFAKQVIFQREVQGSAFTWNLMPVPVELIP